MRKVLKRAAVADSVGHFENQARQWHNNQEYNLYHPYSVGDFSFSIGNVNVNDNSTFRIILP